MQSFSIRMGTAGGKDSTIKRIFIWIDDRSLADGTYQTGYDHQLYQPPPYQPPSDQLSPHRPPPHNPSPRYHLQHPQFSKFFYEEESPICQSNDFENDYGRRRRFTNPNPNRRGRYPNPYRRSRFSNYIRDIGKDTEILISLGFLLLMGVMMLSQPCFGSRKLISFLTWNILSWKTMSILWLINLKEEQWYGGINFKTCLYTNESQLQECRAG